MASAIDDTKPVHGTPTTQSVRDNFTTAKSEITALQSSVSAIPATPIAISAGGTGSTTAAAALTALGAAPLASPVFTGDPRAPTPATADNDTSVATTAYVKAQGYTAGPASWTVGSVPFATSTTALDQDNAGLFYDNTNKRLGIGTTGPAAKLDVVGSIYARGAGGGMVVVDRVNTANFSQWYRTGDITRFWDSAGGDIISYTAAGNVGIGTATPGSKLEVNSAIRAVAPSGGQGTVGCYDGTAGNVGAYMFSAAAYAGIATVNNAGAFQTVAIAMTTGGGVGIGATPTAAAAGLLVGAATGGALGVGKINATEVRANNVVLTSDVELKQDIEALAEALALVQAIEPKSYKWKPLPDVEGPDGEMQSSTTPDFTTRLNRGFLAQDVIEALGGKVEDGVDLGGMVAVLWQAVRELSDRVDELEQGTSIK